MRVFSFFCDDTRIYVQRGHSTKIGDLLKRSIKNVDCAQWVSHIRSGIFQEALSGLIHPKDVCQLKIVLHGGQQTKAVQEASGGHHRMMHSQMSVDVCVSKLKNSCNGEQMCYV